MATSTTPTTSNLAITHSIAKDLGELYEKLYEPRIQVVPDPRTGGDELPAVCIPFLTVPKGVEVRSLKPLLDEFLGAPTRRQGTATLQDRDSFIAHVNRFKDRDSAIFADPENATVTAVYDYHEALAGREADAHAPSPRFGQHRAVYPCPLSDEWQAWTKQEGKAMSQAEFAVFLEDRIGDVVLPPSIEEQPDLAMLMEQLGGRFAGPNALMTLARGLQVNVDTVIKQAVTLDSGEISIIYDEQHRDGAGQPVKVANLFLIRIPVFYGGALYQIPVRLRYRVQGRSISWSVHLYRAARSFEHAFAEVLTAVREGTSLPVFLGAPEK